MKYILFTITVLIIFSGCKKNEKATLYISGTIYNSCYDREPIRNYDIKLVRTIFGSTQNSEVVATGSTNENGYFQLFFPPAASGHSMILKGNNGGDFMEKIPPTQNYDSIEIFASIAANIKVSLNVINPHSIGDTLDIKHLGAPESLKIPCPLSSGTIYTALNYSPINPMGFDGTDDYLSHSFLPSTGFSYATNFKIDKYCQDTVYVTVDIE